MLNKRNGATTSLRRGGVVLLGLAILSCGAPAAWAVSVLGACCFDNGTCDDVQSFECETAGGDFIGDGTSCANTNCRAPVAAPLLSAAGVVAAVSAVGGISILRMRARRRR